MLNTRTRSITWTLNNPTSDETALIDQLDYVYLVYGLEEEEDSQRHFQGYTYFKHGKTVTAFKKLAAFKRAHLEMANGTAAQNRVYCTGQGQFWEYGVMPTQGKRTDLTRIYEAVEDGSNIRDILRHQPNFQGIQVALKTLEYIEPARNEETKVYWYWGSTGVGKTRRAIAELGGDYYLHSGTDRWWPGYDGHKNVLIDDFRGDFAVFNRLLNILDRHPCRVEIKGGHRQLLANKIIITCDRRPQDCYPGKNVTEMAQLLRRITRIEEIKAIPGPLNFFAFYDQHGIGMK